MPGEREDLVQEVHLKVLVNLRRGAFEARSRLRTYVERIARYTCIDRLRGRRPSISPEELPEAALAREAEALRRIEEEERRRAFLAVFQRLPENCRRLWELVYLEGLPYRECAARLGVSYGALKVRVSRCLQRAIAIGRAVTEGG
jgi:RNA polymerase sigma-70 factor (ECF subfamily)